MGERIDLPQTPQGTAEEQLRQMYSYLYRVAEALNHNLSEIGSMDLTDDERIIMQKITAEEEGAEVAAYDWQGKESLKSLIIKTAAFVQNKLDNYRMNLLGEYVTEGKFGKYVRNTSLKVDVTPTGIQQDYTFEEVVQGLKNYTVNAKNYIKTGLLRTVGGLPVYGVAIGKDVVTFSEDGTETYNDGNKVAELTADELSFYQSNNKVASYKGTELVFYQSGVAKMKIDTNGVTILNGSTKLAEMLSSALKFYYSGTEKMLIDTNGVTILNGTTKLAELLSSALKFYYSGTEKMLIDTNGVTIKNGSTKLAELLSTALKFYYNGTLRSQMDTDGISFWNGSTKLAEVKSGEINFYQNSTLMAKYSGNKISFYSGGTEVMYIQNGEIITTGAMKINSGGSFEVDSTNFKIDSVNKKLVSGNWTLDNIGLKLISGTGNNICEYTISEDTGNRLHFQADKPNTGNTAGWHLHEDGSIIPHVNDGTPTPTMPYIGDSSHAPNIYYTNLYQGSSKEVKHNIQPLQDEGEKIDKLYPVTFVYDNDATEKKRYGLIYEDTIPVMPEICTGDEGQKAINYIELIPMLVKEIQDLRKRVKELEAI